MLGPVVTTAVQLINVPVLLKIWGAELYGEWLMLAAIPTYLLLTDLGFGNVAGSDMTMRLHADDRDGVIETFQSTTLLIALCTAVVALILAPLLFLLPLTKVLHLHAMPLQETRLTLLLLCLNCLAMLQWSGLMAGYRCAGRYATGILSTNILRILEGAGFLVIVVSHARPVVVAAYMLCISIAGTLWLVFYLHRIAPWLTFGVRRASWSRLSELSRPAFSYLAFPICAAISTQGMTLVTGLVLAPLAVAMFNPMRTVTRVPLQLTDALKNSFWTEISVAFGRGDLGLARRLHRTAFQLSLLLGGTGVVGMAIAGPWLFQIWTHGRVGFDRSAFYLLLVVVLANALWNASSAVPLASNQHGILTTFYLLVSAVSLGVSAILARYLGLSGIVASMLLVDASMAIIVIRSSTRLVQDTPGGLFRNCLKLPSKLPFKGSAAAETETIKPVEL